MTDKEKIDKEININEYIHDLVVNNETTLLKTILVDLHPADISEAITHLENNDQRTEIINLLNDKTAAEVLIELDHSISTELINNIDEKRIVRIISLMDSDDATEIIDELSPDVNQDILKALPLEEFRDIKTLLMHDEETAGRIMALEIVAVHQNRMVKEALNVLRIKSKDVVDVYNIYLIDRYGYLKGVVSLAKLVLSDPKTRLIDIMDKDFIAIPKDTDQEEVANIFRKYDLVAAPVVDESNKLIGRITADDILEVVDEETTEDMNLMAGITDEIPHEGSIFKLSWIRLPWLMVAFVGQMISAVVMSHYKATLDQILIAAFFIPLIMAMGGNIGIQSATIVIRGLATGELTHHSIKKRLAKELSVTLFNALVISVFLIAVLLFIFHQLYFGILLSFALIAVLINASIVGTLIPFILKKLNFDPAVATAPFITTSNDIIGLFIYLGLLTTFMKWL
ncbi:MAG: magnesium transporter [bacterium]